MEYRSLGRTGLRVSELGFGCGNVGGLIIRGEAADRVRAVSRAVEMGINYFDTAPSYGDGKSESNLGAALKEVGAEVYVGTKVNLAAEAMTSIAEAVVSSVEESLKRLGRDYVDLVQLHNPIALQRGSTRRALGVEEVLDQVVPAFESLQAQGKTRFWGITGLGETEALRKVIETGAVYTVQACHNLLNPSAGTEVPSDFPFQDFGGLIDRAAGNQMGVIGIRALAAGALSGEAGRHPIASPSVAPISSGRDYSEDVDRTSSLKFLIQDGYAGSMVEAAVRFAMSKKEVSTVLVGYSSLEQLEQAAGYVAKGPLPEEALRRLPEVWAGFAKS